MGRTNSIFPQVFAIRMMVMLAVFCLFSKPGLAQPQSLSIANLADEEILELNGEWDFFWKSWIEPGDETPAPARFPSGRAWVAHADGTLKKGQGYASYRLVLTDLKPRMDGYSLAVRSASTAMKLMIYPKGKPHKIRFVTVGRLGLSLADEIPQLRAVSLRFFPEADEAEWVILAHISNFHYSRGGLWTVPLLSPGHHAEARITSGRELVLFCLGMITVIGVYNIVLFLRRPADKPTLMLALFCGVVCLRSAASDNLIAWFFPALDTRIYQLKYLLEYGTMVLGPLACISFVHFTFLASSLPRFYRLVVNLSLLAGILIVALDTYYRSVVLTLIQIVTLAQIAFGLTVVVRAVVHRRAEALLAALGCFILAACVVYDILVTFNVFPQPYLTSLGMSAFVFMQSQVVAQRFAKAFQVAEHLSEKLKDEVERQTLELRSIMENIPQGVFIMLADQTIQGNYSLELEQMLDESNLTGRAALPILFRNSRMTDEDVSIVDSILVSTFHEPAFVWELNVSNLPGEFVRKDRHGMDQIFAIEWHPIVDREEVVDRILVTLRNVTELRDLQASQRKDQEAFSLLLEIVQVSPDRYRNFIQQSQDILRRAQEDKAEVDAGLLQRKVLMRLHTWKGLARSLQFKSLTSHIHDVEQVLCRMTDYDPRVIEESLDALAEKLSAYESVGKESLGRMNEVGRAERLSPECQELVRAWYQLHSRGGKAQRTRLDEAVRVYVQSLPDITTGQLLDTLQHELQSLAQELAKPLPQLDRQGFLDQPLPGLLFKSLSYALLHLVRNSVDHGLEHPDERRALGKNEVGSIRIQFRVQGDTLIMDYQDDGRGLDLIRVRKKAEEQGLVAAEDILSPKDTAAFIFAPGFSTKGEANMISGRGIGMDAVRLLVEECGGTIDLILNEGAGSRPAFHLRASWPLVTLMNQVA